MTGKDAVNSRSVDFAPGLSLQILIAANMVSIGVGVVDGREPPAAGVEKLPDFSSGILVVATVNQANILLVQLHQPNFGRTLDVISFVLKPESVHTWLKSPFTVRIENCVVDRALALEQALIVSLLS